MLFIFKFKGKLRQLAASNEDDIDDENTEGMTVEEEGDNEEDMSEEGSDIDDEDDDDSKEESEEGNETESESRNIMEETDEKAVRWIQHYDTESGYHYYENIEDGTTTWDPPLDENFISSSENNDDNDE